MTDVYFVGNISKRLVCLKQPGGTQLSMLSKIPIEFTICQRNISHTRGLGQMGKKNSGLSKTTTFHLFFLQKSLICPEGISVIPLGGRHNCLLFIPAAPLSWTLEGFLKLTQRPSRAINVARYIAVGIAETQGHCQGNHARRRELHQ